MLDPSIIYIRGSVDAVFRAKLHLMNMKSSVIFRKLLSHALL